MTSVGATLSDETASYSCPCSCWNIRGRAQAAALHCRRRVQHPQYTGHGMLTGQHVHHKHPSSCLHALHLHVRVNIWHNCCCSCRRRPPLTVVHAGVDAGPDNAEDQDWIRKATSAGLLALWVGFVGEFRCAAAAHTKGVGSDQQLCSCKEMHQICDACGTQKFDTSIASRVSCRIRFFVCTQPDSIPGPAFSGEAGRDQPQL
jgi:hypothetical protein